MLTYRVATTNHMANPLTDVQDHAGGRLQVGFRRGPSVIR